MVQKPSCASTPRIAARRDRSPRSTSPPRRYSVVYCDVYACRNVKLTIVVSGMISAVPRQGGAAWAVLQYLLGFRRLGHDVYFVEPIDRESVVPRNVPLAESENAQYFRGVMSACGFERASALLLANTQQAV